jgi:hypothetical protein
LLSPVVAKRLNSAPPDKRPNKSMTPTISYHISRIITFLIPLITPPPDKPQKEMSHIWRNLELTLQMCERGNCFPKSIIIYIDIVTHDELTSNFTANILNVYNANSDPLITKDMLNESQVEDFQKDPRHAKVHFLAGPMSTILSPTKTAYSRFGNTIKGVRLLRYGHKPSEGWSPPPGQSSLAMQALASFQEAYVNVPQEMGLAVGGKDGLPLVMQHLYGAMAALAQLCCFGEAKRALTKVHERTTAHALVKFSMLAGLLVFGPINMFTSTLSGQMTTNASRALLELGCSVAEAKHNNGTYSQLSPTFLDKLRLEFLCFLSAMGFGNADTSVGFHSLKDWKFIHDEFHKQFSYIRVANIIGADLELALSKF